MTKSINVLRVGVGALALAACAPSETIDVYTGGITFEEFAANTSRELGTGYFIVDRDIPLYSLDELRSFYERYIREGALTVDINSDSNGANPVLWSDAQRLELTYCVSTAFGGNYNAVVAAMATATAEWEAPTGVQFIHLQNHDGACNASNVNVLFDVSPTSGQTYFARAFFPDAARARRNILINDTGFTMNNGISLTGLLRHEVGHTLGFRHEHVRSGDCPETGWAGATQYDSASVMHYPWCDGSHTGDWVLTALDLEGAAVVYGQTAHVGVIPNGTSCPASAPMVRFNMDNEDNNAASSISGWTGGIEIDSNRNLRYRFCRVDSNLFTSLNTASSSRSNYAVLLLSARCPAGSVQFDRHFDNEDRNTANSSTGTLWPSFMGDNTYMRFCLFRGGSSPATALPDLGFDYGVFAGSSFSFSTTSNGRGTVFSDDEDNNNANSYYPANAAHLADAQQIISAGGNTTLRTARRGTPYCNDGVCNALETQTSCPADCTPPPPPPRDPCLASSAASSTQRVICPLP